MSTSLFHHANPEKVNLDLIDAEVVYFPHFFSGSNADSYYNILMNDLKWKQDNIRLFGKVHPQPRLTALYASNDRSYSYSGITMHPLPFTKELLEIKNRIEQECTQRFTTCLANLYRNGKDSNGWHADDEKELGQNPVIASVSFGETRKFKLRYKKDHSIKCDIELAHGSLLLMTGTTQHYWQHQIPKTQRNVDPRINLTYRVIQ
ncbi:alpha-ketoglutarate-dependent dioxygenase AlkB [Gangjinia marincola]|uniref:Alpha-ketoglutarate-dependent dioxygenase AlkB n=1 Tax=Gangjinia marincola TaxID=578463 RepID=A0ABN1MFR0_9FLAO